MRKSNFTEAQINGAVQEYDARITAKELARRLGVSENTVRSWKAKYKGMEVADVVRLKQLEAENAPDAAHIIARQTVKLDAMEDPIGKNGWGFHSGKKR